MNRTNNPKLTPLAQKLRRDMTKEERHLWYDFLKTLPVTVRRQKVIGSYIVDFCIPSAKLVIELDGSQHYEDGGMASDHERDQALSGLGFRVLRYSNLDIKQNFDGVCEDIYGTCDTSSVVRLAGDAGRHLPLKGKAGRASACMQCRLPPEGKLSRSD